MTDFDLRAGITSGRYTLDALNSLTKYPSIPTYHGVGDRGRLRDDPPVLFHGCADLTEKIDGTNARIISLPDGTVVVGSREELLWSVGDLCHSAQLGIVDELRAVAVRLAENPLLLSDWIITVYGEVYGHGVGSSGKRYAGDSGRTGFRVFDVCAVPQNHLEWDVERCARWRQYGGQKWHSDLAVQAVASELRVECVPTLGGVESEKLPQTIAETATWLERWAPHSRASLRFGTGDSAVIVTAEGIVIRGFDEIGRRRLAKVRFEDYRRTLDARKREA